MLMFVFKNIRGATSVPEFSSARESLLFRRWSPLFGYNRRVWKNAKNDPVTIYQASSYQIAGLITIDRRIKVKFGDYFSIPVNWIIKLIKKRNLQVNKNILSSIFRVVFICRYSTAQISYEAISLKIPIFLLRLFRANNCSAESGKQMFSLFRHFET